LYNEGENKISKKPQSHNCWLWKWRNNRWF
jgi:hypothetical protein